MFWTAAWERLFCLVITFEVSEVLQPSLKIVIVVVVELETWLLFGILWNEENAV